MIGRPPAPYPDPAPDDWARSILEQGIRGEGHYSKLSGGDFVFYSGTWATIHGPAIVARSDRGAFMIWGAKLPNGRRIYCRRSTAPHGFYGFSPWRRRSDDGRSWVLGNVTLTPDDAHFSDGVHRQPIELDDNVFEVAMASQPEFIRELQDDSVAWTLNALLENEGICSLDGSLGWNPSSGEAALTIGRLRGFGEPELDFKHEYPVGEPLRVDREVLIQVLHAAGWRVQTDEETRRFAPHWFND